MNNGLSLEERVLRSIMEPSRPPVVKGWQEKKQETPKSKELPSDTQLHPGVWIEFFSPLFGMCTARIQEVTVDGCIITDHSVLKGESKPGPIPASWIMGVYREQMAS